MRTLSIVFFSSVASAAAGAGAVLAFWQTSQPVVFAVVALLVGAVVSGWASHRIRKGLRLLSNRLDPRSLSSSQPAKTGLAELDEISQCMSDCLRKVQLSSLDSANELASIKSLLAKFDRRQEGFDRDGNELDVVSQLTSILQGHQGQLDSNVRQAVSCGREIKRATEEVVIGSEQQADLVDQTTSLIESLSAQVLSVCDHAEEAMESSSNSRDTARTGLQRFEELEDELTKIKNQVSVRERKLRALGQHTKEIEAIVQTIGSLSSRTDLLAVNASIESVRAGEHGRGFAVVAEEVRALAEQSAQAVLDITRRIEMIQLETHQSINVTSGEHDQLMTVIQRVGETLDGLKQICEETDESADGLKKISSATREQMSLTRQIIVSLERSTELSKKNRSQAEGANWTAKTLGQVGEQMEDALESFRLPGLKFNQSSHQPQSAPSSLLSDEPEAVDTPMPVSESVGT